MSGKTGIDYLDKNWTVITGCSPISEGCENCYAKASHDMRHKAYLDGKQMPQQYAQPFESIQFHADRLDWPMSWRDPKRVGVCFTGDLFYDVEKYCSELDCIFAIMRLAEWHTFFTLTKRADELARYMLQQWTPNRIADATHQYTSRPPPETIASDGYCTEPVKWPLPNVYNGITAENQARLDERAPELLKIPGNKWLSLEPLLGPVDIADALVCTGCADTENGTRHKAGMKEIIHCQNPRVDWVVVGCESGPNRRPCKLEWIADIVQQCKAAGVPCYVKQAPLPARDSRLPTGQWTSYAYRLSECGREYLAIEETDRDMGSYGWRVSHDPNEWPASIQVREFPNE